MTFLAFKFLVVKSSYLTSFFHLLLTFVSVSRSSKIIYKSHKNKKIPSSMRVPMSQILFQARNLISLPLGVNSIALRGLTTTTCLNKNIRSGVPATTKFRTKSLTYEQAVPPSRINVRKGWLSWNTSNLDGEGRTGETTFEDVIIRKFITGTWPSFLASEVVIKRKHNLIVLSFLVSIERIVPRQVYFLKGYSEELLSHWLKSPVKLEIQTIMSHSDVEFKKI